MAIDPLTASLLTSGNGGGGFNALALDPAIMQAQPEIQLAQQMEQQGLSTAPAYPGAAIARALQGAIGAGLQKSALSDLAKAYAGSSDAMAQIFPQGTPIGDALRNPNPMVRMIALQQAPKALLLNSGRFSQSPGEESHALGNVAPTSISGQPQSPEGKLATDIARVPAAAAPALGSALTKAGAQEETGVQFPPSGIPRTATPTNSVQQPTPQQMGAAKAELGQKLAQVAQSGVTSPVHAGTDDSMAARVAAAKGAQEEAKETGAANVEYGSFRQPQGSTSGPGISEPIQTDHGTQIPPLNAQATVPSDPGVIKEKLPAWQKTITDWTTSLAPSQLAQQRLTTIANAFKSIQTGTFTTQKAQLAAALKSVGLDASGILGDPAQAQLALHENYAETMSQLKAATSRFTQQEFRITSENKEHPNIQPAANLQMLAEDMGSLKQAQDVANDWNVASKNGWKDPQSFETEYLKANKLSDYVAREKQAIGPLKGMTNTATNPVASVHSPAEIQAEMRRRGLIP